MCWLSHLIEARYFDELELFFLIVGHTHNPVDQWFSVIGKCIKNADFIGSVIAMQELFKYACSKDAKTKSSEITVVQLTTYRDYRNFYAPLLNTNIKNFNLPCRYKFSLHKVWGSAYMQYMMVSPKPGWACKWFPLKPPADQDTVDNEGNVLLTPYMLFNGEEAMFKALDLESSSRMSEVVNYTSAAVASSIQDVMNAMSYLRDIEVRAIAENAVRMDQEAESGVSTERIDLSKSLLKSIEEEMLSKNTTSAGYIVWLKRAQCDDPQWLNGAPDVLPNPKKWRQLLQNDKAAEQILTEGTEDLPTDSIPTIIISTEANNDEDAPSGTKTKKKKTPAEKKAADDKKEALTRYLSFKCGIANMTRTASYVLELKKDGQLEVSSSSDIVKATSEFSKSVLTSREVAYYESIQTSEKIVSAVEALVAQVESEPWELLRLPVETEEQKARKQKIIADRQALEATVTANITRLLTKKGTDSLEEILTREGNLDIYLSKNVDDMNKDQLKILAKAAGIKLSGDNKKQKLVGQLRADIKKYMSETNVTVDSLLGTNSTQGTTSQGIQQAVNSSNATTIIPCCVEECQMDGCVLCEICQLQFCRELHSIHTGHTNMQLKLGYSFPREESEEHNSIEAESSTDIEPLDRNVEEDTLEPEMPVAAAFSPPPIIQSTAQVSPAKGVPPNDDGQSKKRKDRGMTIAASTPLSPIQQLAHSLRELVKAGGCEESLKAKLDYVTYDVAFLLKLADSLELDISQVMSCRRPTRGQVSGCIISQLLA